MNKQLEKSKSDKFKVLRSFFKTMKSFFHFYQTIKIGKSFTWCQCLYLDEALRCPLCAWTSDHNSNKENITDHISSTVLHQLMFFLTESVDEIFGSSWAEEVNTVTSHKPPQATKPLQSSHFDLILALLAMDSGALWINDKMVQEVRYWYMGTDFVKGILKLISISY